MACRQDAGRRRSRSNTHQRKVYRIDLVAQRMLRAVNIVGDPNTNARIVCQLIEGVGLHEVVQCAALIASKQSVANAIAW